MALPPEKMEYIVGYERTVNGKRRIRMSRCQLPEVEKCDKVIQRYRCIAAESSSSTAAAGPSSESKRYAWLRDSERFLLVPCANSVTTWVKFRFENPHIVYGMRFTNKLKTEMEILSEDELRAKYRRDKAMFERNLYAHRKMNQEFEALNFKDENECVAKCFTPSLEAKERIQAYIEKIFKK